MIPLLTGAAQLAQLTADSGLPIRDVILGIVGTFIIVVLAVRGFGYWLDDRYGKMGTLVLAAVPIVLFCYFPDTAMTVLRNVVTGIFGGG